MRDNKLRGALVYRVQIVPTFDKTINDDDTVMTDVSISSNSDSSVTLLAAYDHASQSGARKGSLVHTSLLGGRDKAYADAATLVLIENPPRPDCEAGMLGGFKVVHSNVHKVVFGADTNGLCLTVITGLNYPTRVAIKMLTELYNSYSEKFGTKVDSATFNSLNKTSRPLLSSFCQRYDDATKVDKTHEIAGKVEEVKETMHQNIAVILQNTEQIESLADRADNLTEQASVFKRNTKNLRKTMKCKNMKYNIILCLLVIGVLAAAITPIAMKATDDY
mmetsp:Transcript_13151/g.18127  ORF Transcript_13151/g.18127 Transcript_13151/m.18127 type:complete len:277 (-) Transcript_13151:113-943(-)|eukprot:CAMPEP_0185729440 /NCGR_PEP_ID=MMETSP1171-20130828/5723_1 /TAXON_ID=374046 /ORGANISM="Helicotheca tamensis, Strain CCMP826" /LENGTH=276 /DNA_ID=CAMNT_0028398277 /DNA_START=69 /DNA_END=899 /DNA_ORIENTATION=-